LTVFTADLGTEPYTAFLRPVSDNLFKPGKCAATDKQNIRGVNLEKLLLRVFAASLRWNRGDRALNLL